MRSAAYRGRFAPSPTGPLHFGSLVAAVVSYLQAKSQQGEWLVRIEDLDPLREIKGIIPEQIKCLERLGFQWDGEIRQQSNRTSAYLDAIHALLATRKAFYCSCSRRQIAAAKISGKEGWVYPGTCRDTHSEPETKSSVRFNVSDTHIAFEDALQGDISEDLAQDYGDFVIQRADQHIAYLLAVVIDDADQGITEVVRGIDLLTTTSRQIAIQNALNLPNLNYAHFLTATHPDGEKLSKQTHAPSIHGVTDEDDVRYLLTQVFSFLQQNPPADLHYESLEDIWRWAIEHWSIQALARQSSKPVPSTLALGQ